jgi:hypothetical protein
MTSHNDNSYDRPFVCFRYMRGYVYIFENPEAQRVKVGMTTVHFADRLADINDIWLERKVTCQICGGRFVNKGGYVPPHSMSGYLCPSGGALPLEKDVSLAESHLEAYKNCYADLSGSEKGSTTRKIKTLEKRISQYRNYNGPVGKFYFRTAFYTECAEQVELLSHEILDEHLDRLAPFGEVFCCSVTEATEAVESVLSRLELLESAKKET